MARCANDELYLDEIDRLEQVIHAYRNMMIAAGMREEILDAIEDEAYHRTHSRERNNVPSWVNQKKEYKMFPGANAQIYTNEAGEVIGWDYPSYDDGYNSDQDDWYGQNHEDSEPENLEECIEWGIHGKDGEDIDGWWVCDYCRTPFRQMEEEFLD